jgi:hypothetical protein
MDRRILMMAKRGLKKRYQQKQRAISRLASQSRGPHAVPTQQAGETA